MPIKYCHIKRDGISLRVVKDSYGRVSAWTRTNKNIVDQVKYLIGNVFVRAPCETIFEGELWLPGADASAVKTSFLSQDQRLRWDVFAIDKIDSHRVDSFESLENISNFCALWGLKFIPFYLSSSIDIQDAKHCVTEMGAFETHQDVEGFVFKEGNRAGFDKWKPILTCDAVIVDYIPGKEKYTGMVGSLVVAVNDKETWIPVANVGGMSDKIRRDISNSKEKFLGKVVEVAYQRVGSQGRLRHPRFKRFRDDKLSSQCTMEQLG